MKVRWLLFSERLTRPWEGKKRRCGLSHDHIPEQLKNIAKTPGSKIIRNLTQM